MLNSEGQQRFVCANNFVLRYFLFLSFFSLLTEYEMTNSAIPNSNFSIIPPASSNTTARFRMLINSEPTLTCPLLGLKNDPETLTNFASEDNFCHCKGHPRSVPLDHQQMYCLFGYTRCPIFLKRMTAEVKAHERAERGTNGLAPRSLTGMVGLLIHLLGIK